MIDEVGIEQQHRTEGTQCQGLVTSVNKADTIGNIGLQQPGALRLPFHRGQRLKPERQSQGLPAFPPKRPRHVHSPPARTIAPFTVPGSTLELPAPAGASVQTARGGTIWMEPELDALAMGPPPPRHHGSTAPLAPWPLIIVSTMHLVSCATPPDVHY